MKALAVTLVLISAYAMLAVNYLASVCLVA